MTGLQALNLEAGKGRAAGRRTGNRWSRPPYGFLLAAARRALREADALLAEGREREALEALCEARGYIEMVAAIAAPGGLGASCAPSPGGDAQPPP